MEIAWKIFVKTFVFFWYRLKNFCEDLFFFWRALALVFLVLGLEHSCPWPREGLSSERLSLTLASDFFVSMALASSLLSSTPHLLRNFQWFKAPVDFIEFVSTEFAACSNPLSRDNHAKASYPRTQSVTRVPIEPRSFGQSRRKNDAFTRSVTRVIVFCEFALFCILWTIYSNFFHLP